MKKTKSLLVALCALFALSASAQEANSNTDIHFGVKAGINISNITAKSSGVSVSPSSLVGGTGGFFATIPVGKSFAVQPELLYSMMGFKVNTELGGGKAIYSYLNIPVLAKYTVETTGFSAYLGPQIGFLLSAKSKSEGMSEDIKDQLKSTDVSGIVGVEYLFPIGVNVSARYQLGLTNIAKEADQGESEKNKAITFTVGFRF